MAEEELNEELKKKAKVSCVNAKTPIEKLRAKILGNGASGFNALSRKFRIMDDDRNCRLNFEEFKYGMKDFRVVLTDREFQEAFDVFDRDGNGSVDMNEFLAALEPAMHPTRVALVKQCFMLMDKTGDGKIDVKDMVESYDVTKHPKYLSGDFSATRVYQGFLKSFEAEGSVDGIITEKEFLSYYASLSASIDSYAYFELMLKRSWKPADKLKPGVRMDCA